MTTPEITPKKPQKPARVRKYTRKTSFESDKETHFSQSKSPQMGLGNIPGVDLQRFFSYVRFETHGKRGKWLRKMEEAERNKRFNHWIREIMEEQGFTTMDSLQHFLGVSKTTLSRMVYRNTRPVSLGFVLDLAYIFQKDPAEIFPELLWLRDIWMEDFKVMVESAKLACEQGELLAVRRCLEAMEYTTSLYPFPSSEDHGLQVLLRTKAHLTEAQAWLHENKLNRVKEGSRWITHCEFEELIERQVDQRIVKLRENFDEIQKQFECLKVAPKATD